MGQPVDNTVTYLLNQCLIALENHFNADVLVYYGPFEGGGNTFSMEKSTLKNLENTLENLAVKFENNNAIKQFENSFNEFEALAEKGLVETTLSLALISSLKGFPLTFKR